MTDTGRNDITINGGGSIAPGTYENVTINGAGTITGDVVCTGLRINGTGSCAGSVKAGSLAVNGTGTFQEPVQVGEMTVNGDASVRAGLGVGRLVVRGNVAVEGGIAAREVEVRGLLRCRGDLSADTVRAEGTIDAGAVTVTSFDLAVYGPSSVKSIDAKQVTVRAPGSLADVLMFFAEKRLTAETVRANEVWAEHTTARIVSAGNATIGKESRIGLVQYSGAYSIRDNAQVTEARKMEPGV